MDANVFSLFPSSPEKLMTKVIQAKACQRQLLFYVND